jgi:hypothetical protein
MVAKKIFHVLVGFWIASNAFLILYLVGAFLYAWLTGALGVNGPLFFMLPRFAMILSGPLPLAVGIVMWRSRRYVGMGVMTFGVVAFAYWLTVGPVNLW